MEPLLIGMNKSFLMKQEKPLSEWLFIRYEEY